MRYCPSCHDEFEDAVSMCVKCSQALTAELAPGTPKSVDYYESDKNIPRYKELAPVFSGDLYEAEIIKGLLESEGLWAIVEGEELSSAVGLPVEEGARVDAVKVLVRKGDEEPARRIMEDRANVTEEELNRAAEGFDDYEEDYNDNESH